MKFVNRIKEISILSKALSAEQSQIVILYGRRRLGKTRLLQQLKKEDDIYFIADQRETPLQINALANAVSGHIPGFERVNYPDWDSLITTLKQRISKKISIFLDEFPYLVKNSPELPSVLQKHTDEPGGLPFHLVLCGSSQRMMQHLVIDYSSPLYGRANQIIKITPMNVYWLKHILQSNSRQAVEEYSVLGGIPRYWELRINENSLKDTIINNIFDIHGILHEEPFRLFLDDTRDTVQLFTLISIVASGSRRLSEIASKTGKPATSLTRPLQKLIDLGYLTRELPYGMSNRTTKRTLYKIADPFIHFYFSYVVPYKTSLEFGYAEKIYDEVAEKIFTEYCSFTWENICRSSTPALFPDKAFQTGQRWWGKDIYNNDSEIDIVSSSIDNTALIIGEAKWSNNINIQSVRNKLIQKSKSLPFTTGKKIYKVLFLKEKPDYSPDDIFIFTPDDVVDACK
jgi:hypothetical protein